jgi:hypothetical protein
MQIRFAGHVHSLQRLRYIHVIKLAATTGRNNSDRGERSIGDHGMGAHLRCKREAIFQRN